jgi:HAD superfamily hydrolase (TIGR01509 family)
MQIRAVVFDMDGVLIDSHPTHRAAWREFLQSVGIDACDRELEFILEGRTRNEILRHFLGDLPQPALQVHGQRKDEIFRTMEHEIQPLTGVLGFLAKLEMAGMARAVATSASEIRTFATLERMGLGGYFDAVITAADVTAGKPHPMAYRLACEQMKVATQQAVAFDDACAGIQAARSAGMRCIGVAGNGSGAKLREAGAATVIPDFAGLELPWLESLVDSTLPTADCPGRAESLIAR